MTTATKTARHTRITRNAPIAKVHTEEMGVFESIPALPFLVAVLLGEVHARLPRPVGRLLCRELHRVLPADYARELAATVQGTPKTVQH